MSQNKIPITPETKISKLLDHYPQLESVLIEITPTFKKLKNPVLRKTIARVTTIRQAAKIGEISVSEIINRLRREVGINDFFEDEQESDVSSEKTPDWIDAKKVVKTINARPILDRGEEPVTIVIKEIKKLNAGEILKLENTFLPEPLIDKAKRLGYKVWSQKSENEFLTYFTPA